MEMQELSLEKFEEASEIVKKVTQETKLIYSEYFSERYGNKIYFKPENMQRTGAYKVRGAYYKISQLTPEERSRGLITASAGNHAQGVAYAAKLAGVKATVVMPVSTPLIKVNRTKSYGAEVVLYGNVFDEACAHAYELADEHGYTFVHPFNDLEVATGQGSIAMEIIKELPTVDYILVPVGGGGLCTGVSTLAKLLNPLNPLAAIIASASILPPVWPTLTPRLAIKESIFCDTLRNPIAHINQISTFPETASLPTASTCAWTSSSEIAKAGWQNRQERAATISARNKIFLSLFKMALLTKRADWQ